MCFSDDNATKHGRVVAQYRDRFLSDLNPESNPNFPSSLGDLAARLKCWRNTLQATVEETMEPVLRLEDESRTLLVSKRPVNKCAVSSIAFRRLSFT